MQLSADLEDILDLFDIESFCVSAEDGEYTLNDADGLPVPLTPANLKELTAAFQAAGILKPGVSLSRAVVMEVPRHPCPR